MLLMLLACAEETNNSNVQSEVQMLRAELETLKEDFELVIQENHTLQTKVDDSRLKFLP